MILRGKFSQSTSVLVAQAGLYARLPQRMNDSAIKRGLYFEDGTGQKKADMDSSVSAKLDQTVLPKLEKSRKKLTYTFVQSATRRDVLTLLQKFITPLS